MSIKFANERKDLADLLTRKNDTTGEATFGTYAHLALFSAMVGFATSYEFYQEGGGGRSGIEVVDSAIENTQRGGLRLVLAILVKSGDLEIFREGNDRIISKIFEDFVDLGFEQIDNWFREEPLINETDVLLEHMKRVASDLLKEEAGSLGDDAPVEISI